MPNQIVRRSGFTADALPVPKVREVMLYAEDAAQITELAKITECEIGEVAIYAVQAMADAVTQTDYIHWRLAATGHSNQIFEDMQAKTLNVTGVNLITLTNAVQKEMIQAAIASMR